MGDRWEMLGRKLETYINLQVFKSRLHFHQKDWNSLVLYMRFRAVKFTFVNFVPNMLSG